MIKRNIKYQCKKVIRVKVTMSIKPPRNSLDSPGGLLNSASQTSMPGQISQEQGKCRFGFKGGVVLPFLIDDVVWFCFSPHLPPQTVWMLLFTSIVCTWIAKLYRTWGGL